MEIKKLAGVALPLGVRELWHYPIRCQLYAVKLRSFPVDRAAYRRLHADFVPT
jgi:hypothetical protein